ncbi:Hydantoin utilization protein A [Tolypocladium paradoxum]|uniref:Hydantoin utilization protein A n=1 Tax=Tolypocladium paradoxum TaxID=94208 RepID=A0A2S4LAD5_9HYPO|nr:Hydantoin utilization protein A [Tolypocladium paradoxum]
MSLYRIGVDVGGTNTDAAILDIKALDSPGRGVLASHKAPTTPDITSGIEAAIRAVLTSSAVDQGRVLSVTVGTTHFINALVEADARRLDRVAVVRLCGPFTRQIPPFSGFPVGLHGILDGGVHYLDGGLEMDGREIAALDPGQIRKAARDIAASGVKAVALVGVFSPLDHDGIHEERCKRILQKEASELNIVCSHDIGPTGFLERENATILNAAILRTGRRVKKGFRRAMARLNLTCPLYLSQNDGTLIDADTAAEFPIKTFASGPTNSMTGAAFLAGIGQKPEGSTNGGSCNRDEAAQPQILVVDIGGTSTDVCALLPSGFPRQAPGFVEIGGVRTAFSMPEVVSIGLGGGSKVTVDAELADPVSVGPASVGYSMREQARIFGGHTLTATDVVVAAGKAELGDASLIKDVPQATIDLACQEIKKKLETVIDKMKVSAAPVHVLLVGGGALLVTEDLAGVDECIQPVHQGAANAVGAAIAKVSGEVDTVEILEARREKDVIDAACRRAVDLAVEKGAAREDVKIVEINRMPLQYMSQVTIRIQVRAVGKLAVPEDLAPCAGPGWVDDGEEEEEEEAQKVSVPNALDPTTKPTLGVDLESYRPDVRGGVWYVSEVDLELMATGCGVLGTGGGGPTYYEYLRALNVLRSGGKGKMRIVSPKSLNDDDIVCLGAWYGSPSVINERIAGGNEIIDAINTVNKIKGNESFHALLADEMSVALWFIGGGNGMSAFPTGVHFDVPIVDGDAMGRAYPTMYHVTFSVYGYPLVPCAITDAAGNVSVVMSTDTPVRLEKVMRTTAVELGLTCASGTNPLPGSAIKEYGVPNTLSQAWYLGRAVHLAMRNKASYVDAIVRKTWSMRRNPSLTGHNQFDVCAGKLLYTGKIVDVHRYIGGGYTMGAAILAPLGDDERDAPANASQQQVPTDRHMTIPFQNEYLYAALGDAAGSEASQEVVCTVPNLISVLGQDGEAIGSQDLRYGLRVNVIALPAHPLWRTAQGLKVGGPQGFGLDMAEVGVDDEFTEARSVIDEFGA